MKKCPICGLMMRDDAVRCYMCNYVYPTDEKTAEAESTDLSEPYEEPASSMSLEDEIDAFFADNGDSDTGNIFKPKGSR